MVEHKKLLFGTSFDTWRIHIICEDHVQPDVETKLSTHKVSSHFKVSVWNWDFKDGAKRRVYD